MLRRAGYEDIAVFERGERVGGVWHHNTYPGAACDVPSHLYEFSFAPNPRWSRRYAPQAEIQSYLEQVARRHGVLEKIGPSAGVDLPEAGLRIRRTRPARLRALPGPAAPRPHGDLRLHGARRGGNDEPSLAARAVPRHRPPPDHQSDRRPRAASQGDAGRRA